MRVLTREPALRELATQRRGMTSFELVVAFGLLVAAMGSTLPLYVRHQRLLSESRRERVALEELANLGERIAAGGRSGLDGLVPSATAERRLPGVALTTARETTSLGERVILSLSWNEVGRREHPLRLAVWLPPSPAGDAREAEEVP